MPSQDTDEAIMGSRLSDAQDRIEELEAEVSRLRDEFASVHTGLSFFLRPDVSRKPRKDEIKRFMESIEDALNAAEDGHE
jgi:HAMP domain-containing protein